VEERLCSEKKRLSDVVADEFELDPSSLNSFEDFYKDVIEVNPFIFMIIFYFDITIYFLALVN
jgi:hypothetical protein